MSIYRFLSDSDTPDVFFATVINAASRAKAEAIMKSRLTADETVVSVNVLTNGRWLVIQGQAVPAEHVKKHSRLGPDIQFGGAAILDNVANTPSGDQPEKGGGAMTAEVNAVYGSPQQNVALGVIGILMLIIGGYVLIDPTIGGGSEIANIHLLSVGETLSIVGALFIAAQWRPR